MKNIHSKDGSRADEIETPDFFAMDPRFAALLALSGDAVISLDAEKRVTLFNPAAEKLFGYTADQVIGRPFSDLLPADRPEAGAKILSQLARESALLGESHAFTARRRDGSDFAAELKGVYFEAGGQAGYTLILSQAFAKVKGVAALKNAEAKLDAILNNSRSFFILKDRDSRIEYINDDFAAAYGIDAADMMGKTAHQLWPEAVAEVFAAQDRKLLAEGGTHQSEIELPLSDGTKRNFLVTKFPVRDRDGNVAGIGAINTDIHELAETRKELAEQQQLLRSIIDHTNSIVVLKDLKGRFQFVNRRFEETYGIAEGEAVGKTSYDTTPAALADLVTADDKEVMSTGEPIQKEIKVELVPGVERALLVSKFPIRNSEGGIVGVGAFNTDITNHVKTRQALVEAEARLRAIFDNASSSVTLKDIEGRFQYVSARFEQWYGLSAADVVGKTAFDFTPREQAEVWAEQERRVLETGAAIRHENMVTFADGSQHTVQAEKFPVRGPDDEIIGIGTITNDITERVLARREAEESQRRFRDFLDNLPDAITLKDLEGRVELVNQEFTRRYGATDEEMRGHTLRESLPERDWHSYIELDREIASGARDTFEGEWEIPGLGHASRHVRVRKFPVFDSSGSRTGVGTISTDITAYKRAEAAQRESEERFRALIDNLPNAVSLRDHDHRYVLVNRAFGEAYGCKPEDAIGRTSREIFSNHDWPEMEGVNTSLLAGEGGQFEQDLVFDFAAGDRRTYAVTKFTVAGLSGGIASVGTISTDITERKRIEKALRESEQKFRAIFEKAVTGITLVGADGRFIDANAAILQMFGYERDAFIGKSVQEVTAPDDVPHSMAQFRALVDGRGGTARLEKKYIRSDGREFDASLLSAPVLDENGEFKFTVALIEDITERKKTELSLRESEQWFRGVIDNVPASMSLKDTRGKYLYVNRSFSEWYDIPASEAVGKDDYAVFAREDADRYQALDREVERQKAPLQREVSVTFSDGVKHVLYGTKFPVNDETGSPIGSGFFGFDITNYKRTEEMLRQAQKMEVVGQLTGGVAHDFNNLLAVVIGNIELLQEKLSPGSLECAYATNAFGAAERGAALTHQLLAFSRQQVLQPSATDIGQLVGDINKLMSLTLGEKMQIDVKIGKDLKLVNVDRGQLENAILNLSINARDAMPHGGTLEISVDNVTRDALPMEIDEATVDTWVHVAVADTGAGIPDDVMERVFEPFFTTKGVGEGSGLGLSMVFGFVRQSGGYIHLDSALDQGTTVHMYFPVADAQTVRPAEAGKPSGVFYAHNGETVMLVEDEPEVCEIIQTVLESLGYRVTSHASAESACQALEDQGRIDLLLSDVGLAGGMDGHSLAGYAAACRPEMKIVLMSGYTDKGPAIAGSDSPVAAFIRKPCRKAVLAETLHRVLYGDAVAVTTH